MRSAAANTDTKRVVAPAPHVHAVILARGAVLLLYVHAHRHIQTLADAGRANSLQRRSKANFPIFFLTKNEWKKRNVYIRVFFLYFYSMLVWPFAFVHQRRRISFAHLYKGFYHIRSYSFVARRIKLGRKKKENESSLTFIYLLSVPPHSTRLTHFRYSEKYERAKKSTRTRDMFVQYMSGLPCFFCLAFSRTYEYKLQFYTLYIFKKLYFYFITIKNKNNE